MWCIVIICWLICTAVSLGIRCVCHALVWYLGRDHAAACTLINLVSIALPINHNVMKLLFHSLCLAISQLCKCRVNLFFFCFTVCVFSSNEMHYTTRLLGSHRVQNNKNVLFFCIFFFPLTAAFTIEFECHAFSARVVWLSTDRELCWIPFLSSCFNQCELAPLSYFMRGDFSASPLCRWFWLPLLSLVFKRWILVLTRELTLLPSLSPDCLPYCFTRLDILSHVRMQITLSESRDAGFIYRCFQNEARGQKYYTEQDTPLTHLTPTGLREALYTVTEIYMFFFRCNATHH